MILSTEVGSPIFRGVSKFSGGFLQIFGGEGVLQFFGGGAPPEYGQRSAGTHPTGMHSCFGESEYHDYLLQQPFYSMASQIARTSFQ